MCDSDQRKLSQIQTQYIELIYIKCIIYIPVSQDFILIITTVFWNTLYYANKIFVFLLFVILVQDTKSRYKYIEGCNCTHKWQNCEQLVRKQ